MEGKISIEKGKDGFIFIVFAVKQKNDVNELTLDMMGQDQNHYMNPETCLDDMRAVLYAMKKQALKQLPIRNKRKRGKKDGFFEMQSEMDTPAQADADW